MLPKESFISKILFEETFQCVTQSSDGKVQENVKKFRFQTGMFTFWYYRALEFLLRGKIIFKKIVQCNIGRKIYNFKYELKNWNILDFFLHLSYSSRSGLFIWGVAYIGGSHVFLVTAGYQFYLLDSYHCSTSKRNCKAAQLLRFRDKLLNIHPH